MALTEPHYRWRAKDTTSPWRKKRGDPWRLLPHFMTESGAAEWSRAYGMEVQKVEGSGEVRQIHEYKGPPWAITKE